MPFVSWPRIGLFHIITFTLKNGDAGITEKILRFKMNRIGTKLAGNAKTAVSSLSTNAPFPPILGKLSLSFPNVSRQ